MGRDPKNPVFQFVSDLLEMDEVLVLELMPCVLIDVSSIIFIKLNCKVFLIMTVVLQLRILC